MLKTLTIVLGLLVIGCKTDAPEKTTAANQPSEPSSNAKPRSGKIDLPTTPQRPQLPAEEAKRDVDDDRVSVQAAREERRRERMAEIDTDGDGVISDAEREAARAKREAELAARLDTNKDGVVSEEERGDARRQRAVDMHARFDSDGDGKLTQQELATSPFARFNANADTNGDGTVTVDELDAAMRDRQQRGPWRRGGQFRGGSAEPPIE